MKILVVNSILRTPEKGIIPDVRSIKDSMIYKFCMGFKLIGHDVELVAANEYRPAEHEDYDFKIFFMRSFLTKIFKPTLIPFHPELISFIREKSYDIIISSESFSLNTLICSFFAGRKLIIWQELFDHNRIYKKIPSIIWYNIIVRLFYRDSLIVPRSLRAHRFISQYHKRVLNNFVEHGIDTDLFRLSDKKEKYFVVISQLIQRKNIGYILQVFSEFKKKYDILNEYRLLVIGSGPLKKELIQKCNELNMEKYIDFLGFKTHDEIVRIWSKAMALLVATRQDNNLVTIPESIACGTPVLCNTVPSNSDYVHMFDLGIVRNEWDENDLKTICDKNSFFVGNCIKYRRNLSNSFIAKKIINSVG